MLKYRAGGRAAGKLRSSRSYDNSPRKGADPAIDNAPRSAHIPQPAFDEIEKGSRRSSMYLKNSAPYF
jgi:hypothetical protein